MDADSSTGNDNSESGECDSFNDDNSNLSRQSPKSERTNIDALDDTARDTIILPPTTDDSSNSIKSLKKSATIRVDLSGDHELLDFGDDGEIVGDNDKSDDDQDEGEGEIEDDGEIEEDDEEKAADALLEEGEVGTDPLKNEEEGEELEEGEVTDDEERKDKPICRFFSKGQCTWGTNCRFLHPGVTDKGLYTMFDPMRPLLPLPVNPVFAPKPGLLGIAPPNFPPLVKEEPVIESAWERGLRHAKEIIKQSVKRKETDVDFEEKKMNLSLAQEDLDKENDYYVRKPTTPEAQPPQDDFDDFEGLDWPPPPAAQSVQSENDARLKIDPDFVRERVHRLGKSSRGIREAPPRDGPSMIREAPPLHEPEVRMVRESALRRNRFDSFNSNKGNSRRPYEDPRKAEEWHDPWMRSKSPGGGGGVGGGGGGGGERVGVGGRTSRKDSSVSKRSSYSSGSSKSSSRSSSSSKSSRSSSSKSSKSSRTSQKSGGAKGRRKELRKAPPRKFSPKPVRIAPPPPPKEEFGRRNFGPPHFDRPTRYAPPPPPNTQLPKKILADKDAPKGFLRERDIKKRLRRRSRSWSASSSASRSRSRSRTFTPSRWSRSRSKSLSKSRSRSASSKPRVRSKFSRERSRSRSLSRRLSSKSRSSSSSSSSSTSFKKTRKRKRSDKSVDVDNNVSAPSEKQSKLDNSPKIKPPHKGQIKMTLKSSSGFKANRNVLERLSDDFVEGNDSNSIKEISPAPNEDISKSPFEDPSSLSPKESKTTRVRREELLKQLKAVEEAIAKKRSKLDKT